MSPAGGRRSQRRCVLRTAGSAHDGRLAQLVERLVHTEEVIGSSPVSPTRSGGVGPTGRPLLPCIRGPTPSEPAGSIEWLAARASGHEGGCTGARAHHPHRRRDRDHGGAGDDGYRPVLLPARRRRRPRGRRAARPAPAAGRRRGRRGRDHRLARRPGGAAALRGARARAGGAGGQPEGAPRHRTADHRRLLLRLRRRHPVHPGGPQGDREGHGPDRQGGPDLPPVGRHRGRGARRAARRAVQARADRPQGRPGRGRRRVRRGRPRRAEHLPERARRRPRERAGRLAGPVPRAARPEHPGAGQRASS